MLAEQRARQFVLIMPERIKNGLIFMQKALQIFFP